MSAILNSIVPLFAVIFLGYFAGRARFLEVQGIRGLVAFIFNFGLPALLFRLMARTDVGEITEWSFLLAYFATEVLMFLFGALVGGAIFGLRLAERVIHGFGCAFSNGVLLGLPMLLWLYGEPGGVPALFLITLNVLSFSLVTMLLELSTRRGAARSRLRVIGDTLRSVARNPIIMATFGGFLYGLTGLALPEVADRTLGFLGQAAAPAALFGLGATLSLRRIGGSLAPAGFVVAAKLLLHPLLAFALLFLVLDVSPLWATAGVLFAACPVGVNVFIFAQHYEAAVETASTAILVSTGLAMLTIAALLLLLPPIPP